MNTENRTPANLRPSFIAVLLGLLAATPVVAQGTYGAISTFATGNGPSAVTYADLDNDGDNDLLVANSLDSTVSIMVNNGSGSFTQVAAIACGVGPAAIEVVDIDGNGTLDIITANLGSDDVALMLNNGVGYAAPVSVPTGGDPISLAIADLDGDGDKDIVTANFQTNNLSILTNQGGGVFSSLNTPFLGAFPSSVVVTDLDRDNDPDIAVCFTGFGVVGVYGRQPSGYVFDGYYAVGLAPFDLKAVDLDFNGQPELVTTNLLSNSVSVLRNLGSRTFAPAANYPVGNRPVRIATTQSDNSLGVDLAVTCFNDFAVSILKNNTNATLFTPAPEPLIALTPSAVVSCDVNGDFFDDIIVTSVSQDNVAIILNQAPTVPYPGTNEDLQLATGVNAPVTTGVGAFIKRAHAGDQLAVAMSSPGLTLAGTPTNLGVQLMLPGFPPIPGIPNLWLNSYGFGANVIYFTSSLAPAGESIVATVPAGLAGASLMIQAFAYTPLAANGIVTTTNGHEIKFVP